LSTSPATIDHMLDSLAPLALSARKMFGEYALYLDGKVVALVCDDRLFLKPTAGAVVLLPDVPLAPPYPGAKGHLDATELLDDPDAVVDALRAVARDLPQPKPKSLRKAK
jgi:TfoX/Sxy family transcriptional regulator of competence genes